MATLAAVAFQVGPLLLDPDPVSTDTEVEDVCLHGPGGPISAGDLVVATWVRDVEEATQLVRAAGSAGAAGIVVDRAADEALRALARRHRVGLAAKAVSGSWAEVFRGIQSVLGGLGTAGGGVGELDGLADRTAELLGGPITIEGLDGRVLAHSTDQHEADAARRHTVMHRTTPPERIDQYRQLGVYESLAGRADQVLVPGDGATVTRVVLPVHDEQRGGLIATVWVIRATPLEAVDLDRANPTLVTIGRLLGGRASGEAATGVQMVARTLRAILQHAPTSSSIDLGAPPWVVGVINAPVRSPEVHLTVWHGLFRRRGWREPLVTSIDSALVCVLRESGAGPGTLAWWIREVGDALADPSSWVAVGGRAMSAAELRASHTDALELVRLGELWPELGRTVLRREERWAELCLQKLLDNGPTHWLEGPLDVVRQLPDDLVRTLWAYLETDASIPRTAERLSVHPNTLRYRLGRLERAGVTLDRQVVRHALLLQMLGQRRAGQLPY
jgi:hypothetical protein